MRMPPLQQHAYSNFQVKSDVVVPSSKRADPRVQKRMVKEARIVTIEPPPSDPSNKLFFSEKKTKSSSVPPKSSSPAPKSPGRKSEPREAPPQAAASSSKSATPPPAPSIREEYKGKFKDSPLRPAASKKAAATSKQPRDGLDGKREKKRSREERRGRSNSGSSSSPSPPPTKAGKSRVAHVPKKKNFRIPKKKGGGGDGAEVEEGFEVGPHVEFNNGKKPNATAKKRPAAAASATAATSTANSAQAGTAKASATASSKSQKRGKLNEE